jgi:CBS domain-containing protein
MRIVREIVQTKGGDVWSTTPDTPVYEALKLMAEKEVGALVVLEGDKVVGILSERDYARKVILKGKSSMNTPVKEVMTSKVLYVKPEQAMEECMALMTDKRVRHLPVLAGDSLVGLISIGDVVKEIITEQKIYIHDLEKYIEGRGYGQ